MCEYALDHGWKSYRGHQIFQWLYRNRVFDIDEMTNVSKETREILKKDFIVNPLELIKNKFHMMERQNSCLRQVMEPY